MRALVVVLVLLSLVGCNRGSSMRVSEMTTTIGVTSEYSRDTMWSAALETFSQDQRGVTGTFGLSPQRVQVQMKDGDTVARRMPVSWYEVNEEAGTITTDWLDISSKQVDDYCKCPENDKPGMIVTSVQLKLVVTPLPQGSSLNLSTTFQQYKDDPQHPGHGKTSVCTSKGRLEKELPNLILERAKDKQ